MLLNSAKKKFCSEILNDANFQYTISAGCIAEYWYSVIRPNKKESDKIGYQILLRYLVQFQFFSYLQH